MKKNRAINLVLLLGKPGAGKGTRSKEFLRKNSNWRVFSTGDALRAEKAKGTTLGMKAKDYMDKGLLVPDELMAEILKSSLEDLMKQDVEGVILDGFPRNCSQVEMMQKLDIVTQKMVEIYVEDDEAIRRLSNRLTCSKCGESYTKVGEKEPAHEGLCDICGAELIVRADDTEEKAEERLKVYYAETAPAIPKLQEIFAEASYLKIPTVHWGEEGQNDEKIQETFERFLDF